MKRETVIHLAPSSLRKLANYALDYLKLERESGYGKLPHEQRFHQRIEAAANTILRDTSKRRLSRRQYAPRTR